MRRIAAALVGLLAVAACSSPAAAPLDRRPSQPPSPTAPAPRRRVRPRAGPETGRPRRG